MNIVNKDGSRTVLRNGDIAFSACVGTVKRTGARYELDVKLAWDKVYYRASNTVGDWHPSKLAAIKAAGIAT